MDLHDKTALVTGGAVRIGRAICEGLASEGARVIIHYHDSRDEAEAFREKLSKAGTGALALRADLSREDECRDLMRKAADECDGVDVLVNSAAMFVPDRLGTLDTPKLIAQMQLNLIAPMILTREFSRIANDGAIVNVLDRRIKDVDTEHMGYWIGKRALADFTRAAALELAPRIRVNAVAPGAVLPPPRSENSTWRELAGKVPLAHECSPQDVADAVCYLCTRDYLTGQVVFVDGGQHLLSTHTL